MPFEAACEARRLVLASASPRRRELLWALGLAYEVVPSLVDEDGPARGCAREVAARLALAKAEAVAAACPGRVVLGADTLVVLGDAPDETVLGKPVSSEDASRMLSSLSGRAHRVVTGIAVVARGLAEVEDRIEVVSTRVVFRRLSADEVFDYVATGEPMDKAGAYAIQGGAAAFVERVEGDYYNVVGLGLEATIKLLRGLLPVPDSAPPPPPTPFPVIA
jgi:septum formation protein